MAVPFASLIPQRSRVLPQGGAILGQLTGSFQRGLEAGRLRAAEDEAPGLIMDYLDAQAAGYQPTLGNLAPATTYVGGQGTAPPAPTFNGVPTRENADLQTALTPGSETFDGRFALRRKNAEQQNPPPVSPYVTNLAGYGTNLNTTGLDAQFGTALDSAIAGYLAQGGDPAAIQVNDLVRSNEEQQAAWDRYQRGEIGLAARPGTSRHEYGAAADIQSGPFLDWLHQNAGQYGLSFLTGDAFARDPVHVQLSGSSPAGTRAPAIPAGTGGTQTQPGGWQPPTGQERVALRAMFMGAWATGDPNMRQWAMEQLTARMTPPTPQQPDYGFTEVNGVLYATDPRTGQAMPVAGSPTAAQVEPPEVRELIGPDGQVHAYGFNPQTGLFDIDYGRADSGGQTINVAGSTDVGTIPQGYRLVYDDQGRPSHMEPIPGGPAAIEADRLAGVANAAGANANRQTSVLLTNLDGAMQLAEQPFTTGFTGAVAAAVPGTPAYDLRARVDTIKAIIGFQTLQEMRNASPNGAALGAITERELQFLQSTWGSLDPNQSYGAFVRQLQNARQITIDIVEGRRTVDEDGDLIQRPAGGGTAPEGTVVRLPDGTLQIKQNGQWVPYGG